MKVADNEILTEAANQAMRKREIRQLPLGQNFPKH